MKSFKDYDTKRLNNAKEVESIKKFPDSDKKILLLFGKTGTGKTHLSIALMNQQGFRESNVSYKKWGFKQPNYKFIAARKLYFLILEAMYPSLEIGESFLPEYTYKSLTAGDHEFNRGIIIDDLGSEKNDEKENFKIGLTQLLEEYRGKFIITTNLDLKDLGIRYGDKILSRLLESCLPIAIDGADYRLKRFSVGSIKELIDKK
jgi:hypothetical protein